MLIMCMHFNIVRIEYKNVSITNNSRFTAIVCDRMDSSLSLVDWRVDVCVCVCVCVCECVYYECARARVCARTQFKLQIYFLC